MDIYHEKLCTMWKNGPRTPNCRNFHRSSQETVSCRECESLQVNTVSVSFVTDYCPTWWLLLDLDRQRPQRSLVWLLLQWWKFPFRIAGRLKFTIGYSLIGGGAPGAKMTRELFPRLFSLRKLGRDSGKIVMLATSCCDSIVPWSISISCICWWST